MEFPKAGSGPNRKQIIDALRNTAQSASNMVAENASVPVDALAWALRKMGVPVGDKPVMGSDWMREKGLTAPTQEGASKVVGDTIGMISPMGFTKQGAQAMIDAGSKLKGLPVGMSIKDVGTPQEVAATAGKTQSIVREGNPIQSAVVLIGDKIFTGRTHTDAFNRAIYEGVIRKDGGKFIYPKDAEINSDLFMTKDGQIIDRFQASKMFDIGSSETAIKEGLMQNKPAGSMGVDAYVKQAEALKQQR
jgi:hypothetical protein